MKQELLEIGKKVAFQAGKYMPKALIGVSAGASLGALYLAFEAGREYQKMKDNGEEITPKDYARIFWKPLMAESFALACEFAGLSESERRYAAAATLASVYESKEKEIDAKAREIFGDNEVEKMHDQIAKDRLERAPEPMPFDGSVFLDILTGQYIYMGTEDIKARINRLNDRINQGYSVSVDEYCDIMNLFSKVADQEIVWNTDLTGIITPRFTYHTLASGREVAALELNEPRLIYYDDAKEYARTPGWAEV